MSNKSIARQTEEKIIFKFENAWDQLNNSEKKQVFKLNNSYKKFLDKGKTERECTSEIISIAEENGYINIDDIINRKEEIKNGTKIYVNNKGKSAALFVIGKEPLEKGLNIVAAHIDSPRLDLKPFPLYEDSNLALLKTHYYGGVKKYQWTAIPLSLHGVVTKKNGEKVHIVIGEDKKDPTFFITDLLPHLAKDQLDKKLGEGITGEELNILVGSIPYEDKDVKERIKLNVMKLLNDKYGIEEDDFLVAEIEIVPAAKARDVGFDRSLIGAYGHDDRACSFTALQAILEIDKPSRTTAALFVDKEEVGSVGNTSMNSRFFENSVAELIAIQSKDYCDLKVRRSMANSRVLSADTAPGFDPNFPDVVDKRNTAFIGNGVILEKYAGKNGKAGSNDSNAEFLAEIRKIFNNHHIVWQIGELGKVDQGGGGTVAYILANYGAEVVDCAIPTLSLHAPMEIVSKVDVYMGFKAYKAFLMAEQS